MRKAFFILVVALAAPLKSEAQAVGTRFVECVIWTNRMADLKDKCLFQPIGKDGSFMLSHLSGSANAIVQVTRPGEGLGYIGPIHAPDADTAGGWIDMGRSAAIPVYRDGACWLQKHEGDVGFRACAY